MTAGMTTNFPAVPAGSFTPTTEELLQADKEAKYASTAGHLAALDGHCGTRNVRLVRPERAGECLSALKAVRMPAVAKALTFERAHQLGYDTLPAALKGSPVTDRSTLKPENLGKTPTKHAPDGRVYSGDWPNWTSTTEDNRLYDEWRLKYGDAIGVRGGETVAFDIDVTDPALASSIDAIVVKHAGDTVTRLRTGGTSKRLRMYRTATQTRKRRLAWEPKQALELLATGQYWNLVGPHPSGDVYKLDRPLPSVSELPVLTAEQVDSIFAEVKVLLASHGITTSVQGRAVVADRSNVDQASLLAPSDDALADAIERLENTTNYEEWLRVGIAIKAAAHDKERGRELFVEFSSRWHGDGGDPDEAAGKYDSFTPPFSLGWAYLLDLLRQQGEKTAEYDFEALTEAPPTVSTSESATAVERSAIAKANEEFALVVSRPRLILWRRPGSEPVLIPIDHWRTLMKARAPVGRQSFAEWWLTHPQRLLLEDIVIEPELPPLSVVMTPAGPVFNQWPGFATRPSPDGSDDLIVGYIRDVVASGNVGHFNWAMNYLAAMVQQPGRLPGTALVLRGGVGVGKTTLTDIMRRLVGPRLSLVEDKPGRLVGTFNASLEGKVLVGAEEAFFAGDRSTYGALKHLVTADTLTVEEKHERARPIRNMAHIIMTTNEHWAVPASQSERRFTVLDVSDIHQGDREYFGGLRRQLENGGAERFMYRLLHEVKVDWSLIARPLQTEALLDQQLDSMDGLNRWWLERLRTGRLPGGTSSPRVDEVYDDVRRSLGDKYEAGRASHTKIGRFLQKNGARKERVRDGGNRVYRYVFPPLADARAAFAARLAATPEWDEVPEWQEEMEALTLQ